MKKDAPDTVFTLKVLDDEKNVEKLKNYGYL